MFDRLTELVSGAWWSYLVVFAVSYLDAIIPLVPSETLVVTAGVLSSAGDMILPLVIVAAAVGAFLGDNTAYLIGRRYGERVEARFFKSEKAQERLRWAEKQLDERGGEIILVARFIPGAVPPSRFLRARSRCVGADSRSTTRSRHRSGPRTLRCSGTSAASSSRTRRGRAHPRAGDRLRCRDARRARAVDLRRRRAAAGRKPHEPPGGRDEPVPLQHADNPVDWYPWGEEALARAHEQDRPILLLHRLRRLPLVPRDGARVVRGRGDSAAPERALIVNVKVDREERPDLDAIYMDAVVTLTGHGGWPLTAFLTPEGEPFYGGTYFPPEPRHGLPSFRQVLEAVAEAYRERRADVARSARDSSRPSPAPGAARRRPSR